MKSYLPSSLLLLVGHSSQSVAICLRTIMDGPRAFWPSDSVLPEPPIIQHICNMSVAHNSQLKHRNLGQLNFRFYIEMIQKRNESVAPSPRS